MGQMANVLFVCLHNAGRSQVSQALFERAADGRHTAESAGTTPADRVHPEVVEAMDELGIDVSDRTPRRLSDELAARADVIVTMGCGDECPFIPGKRYVDWDLPDPKGRPLPEVREIRDEIGRRVASLVGELDFESLVADAIDRLPAEFRQLLEKVPVVISELGAQEGAYGQYYGDGVARESFEDRIVIYRDTLERDFGHDPGLLEREVERTLRHELGHHLGHRESGVRGLGL
jgi:arsenate reductase (thioredoxin)